MKSKRNIFVFGIILILSSASSSVSSAASAENPTVDSTNGRVGAGLAVTAFNPEEGFKLSERAQKALGVQFMQLPLGSRWNLSKSALVRLKHSTGVYRRVDGWIAFVLVKVVKDHGREVVIESDDLQSKDEIAISGTAYLRTTEVDLTTDAVDGCAH